MMLHHLARLEMMKAEEQGIDLSYEEAIKIVENEVGNWEEYRSFIP